ncbi:MAG: contractile injection system tape measure protein [bacterium]|nr:contractile injection system tape measure protein [bacterium]
MAGPENKHEINQIRLELDGQLSNETLQSLKDEILAAIESCFDEFSGPEDHVFIDKIELDLGEIKSEHLLEEFKVRIIYLLRQEFEKSLTQMREKQKLSPPRRKEKRLIENFLDYLVLGYSKAKESGLSSLFEQISKENVDKISEIFDSAYLTSSSKERILNQIRFGQLDTYWTGVIPGPYKEIRKINLVILEAYQEVLSMDYDLGGAQGVIKKITLQFLLGKPKSQITPELYLEEIKRNISLLKPHSKKLKKPLEVVLQEFETSQAPTKIEFKESQNQISKWEQFAKQRYPDKFKVLDQINIRTAHEISKQFSEEANITKIREILTQLALEAIISDYISTEKDYIKFLVQEIERIRPLVKNVRIEKLKSLITQHKSGESQNLEAKISFNNIKEYLLIGRSDSHSWQEISKSIKQSITQGEIKTIDQIIQINASSKEISTQLNRLLLLTYSVKEILEVIRNSLDKDLGDHKSSFLLLLEINESIVRVFNLATAQDILTSQKLIKNLFEGKISSALRFLSQLVEAKKRIPINEFLQSITTDLKKRKTDRTTKKLISEAEKLVATEVKEDTESEVFRTGTILSQYMYFLKTGIWKNREVPPQKALEMILEDSIQPFINQLRNILSDRISWTRLIFQNPIEIVFQIFEVVFEDDEKFEELAVTYRSHQKDPELNQSISRLFELFIEYKIASLTEDISFENLLQDIQSEQPPAALEVIADEQITNVIADLESAFLEPTEEADKELEKLIKDLPETDIREIFNSLISTRSWYLIDTFNQHVFSSPDVQKAVNIESLSMIVKLMVQGRSILLNEYLSDIWMEMQTDPIPVASRIVQNKPFLANAGEKDTFDFLPTEITDFINEISKLTEITTEEFKQIRRKIIQSYPVYSQVRDLKWHLIEEFQKDKKLKESSVQTIIDYLIEKDETLALKTLRNVIFEKTKVTQGKWPLTDKVEQLILQAIETTAFDWVLFEGADEVIIDKFLNQISEKVRSKLEELLRIEKAEIPIEVEIPVSKQLQLNLPHISQLLKPIGEDSEFYEDITKYLKEAIEKSDNTFDLKIYVIQKLHESTSYSTTIIQALANNWFKQESSHSILRHYIKVLLNEGEKEYLRYLFSSKVLFQKELISSMESSQFDWTVFRGIQISKIISFLDSYSEELKEEIFNQLGLAPALKNDELAQKLSSRAITITRVPENKEAELKDFEQLLRASIISGLIKYQPVFEDESHFQEYFKNVINTDYSVISVFEGAPISETKKLLSILDKDLKNKIQSIVTSKIPASFQTFSQSLIRENRGDSKKLEELTLAFVLTRKSYEYQEYINVLEREISELTIPVEYLLEEDDSAPVRKRLTFSDIKILIDYLKYEELKTDEFTSVQLLLKVISESPIPFLAELRKQVNLSGIISRIIEITPKSKLEWLANSLVPELPKIELTAPNKSEVYSERSIAQLITQKIRFGEIQELEFILKADEEMEITPIEVLASKDSDLSSIEIGIREQFILEFDSFQLLEELIATGKIPYWSNLKSIQEIEFLVDTIFDWHPEKAKKLISTQMSSQQHIRNFFSLVGSEIYIMVFKYLDKKVHDYYIESIEAELAELEDRITYQLSTEAMKELIDSYYSRKHILENDIRQIISSKIKESNLSITVRGSKDEPIEDQTLAKERIPSVVPEPEEIETAETIAFLLEEEKVPWWSEIEFSGDQWPVLISNQLKTIDSQELPTILLYIQETYGTAPISKLAQILTQQDFDEILNVIQPNFFGFIESLRLILEKIDLEITQKIWQDFVLGTVISKNIFQPQGFVKSTIRFISEITKKPIKEVKAVISSQIDKTDEARYLAIKQLLQQPETEELESPGFTQLETALQPFHKLLDLYMKYGVLKYTKQFPIRSSHQLALAIKNFGEKSEVTQVVTQNISNSQIRTRIIKSESAIIIWSYIQILFPSQFKELTIYNTSLKQLFALNSTSFSTTKFDRTFFEFILENKEETNIQTLIKSAIKILQTAFNISTDSLDPIQIEKIGLDPRLFDLSVKSKSEEKPQEQSAVSEQLSYNPNESLKDHLLINTAGIVIFSPYLTRYFDLLEMTKNGQFKDVETALRAVHLLNFIATGKSAAPEHELMLNKVLCGVPILHPLPMEIDISDKEREITEGMIKGAVLQNWDRMKNSSIEALREGFLIRDGYLSEKDKSWELKVEKKTLDILMESIPWSFSTVKLPWMEKLMNVEWQ